jgi:hypothetical protein
MQLPASLSVMQWGYFKGQPSTSSGTHSEAKPSRANFIGHIPASLAGDKTLLFSGSSVVSLSFIYLFSS